MPALRKALIAAARTRRRRGERQRQPELEDHRACGAARRAAAAQGEEHRRGGLGQGRRGQEHHGRQPGAGAGGRRRQRRHPRCRHLRPQPADDDGHFRPPGKQRRQDHGADAELRRAGDVDRLPHRRRQPDDLARADGHAGARTAAAPDQLERPGLPDRRHAAGHRRHPAHAVPEGAADRRADRHHAAGHRAARRAQGPEDVREGRCADPRHRREHGRVRVPELRPQPSTSSVPMAAEGWRPSTASTISARCR